MSIFDRRTPSDSADSKEGAYKARPANTPRALTASAVRVNLKDKKEIESIASRRNTDQWQDEAWEYYDYIPEVSFSANLVANILSRINLYVGYVENSAHAPSELSKVPDGKLPEDFIDIAGDILYLLESGNGGSAGILRDAALNFFIAGECYLVREPARFSNGMQEKYQIRSVKEIINTTISRKPTLAIKPRRDSKPIDYINIPSDGYAARLWKSHPAFGDEADSSMRSLLEVCDQLLLLERAIAAQAKAMIPAGLLFIPDGIDNGRRAQADTEAPVDPDDEDYVPPMEEADFEAFEEELIRNLLAPVGDDTSASSVIPLLLRGAPDLGEKIRHIQLSRPFDPAHSNMAQAKLDRILAGLDIPKDVAAGLSGVKYSNAILIEEQLYKAHIEPLILMIVDCLTTAFLRPALLAQGFDPAVVSRAVVWYDPSMITAKPSRAEASITLYGLGAVSLETVRRANGFSNTDAPSDMERLQRFAMEKGMLNEAVTEKVVNTIIPKELQTEIREEQLGNSDPNAVEALDNALGGTDMEPVAPAASDEPAGGPPPTPLLEP